MHAMFLKKNWLYHYHNRFFCVIDFHRLTSMNNLVRRESPEERDPGNDIATGSVLSHCFFFLDYCGP